MNQIQYFKHQNGLSWGAVAPGQFEEAIIFWADNQFGDAHIELNRHAKANASYYDRADNSYCPCSCDEYLTARSKALASIAEFSGRFQPEQALPVSVHTGLMQGFLAQVHEPGPLITLATGAIIINDLPF